MIKRKTIILATVSIEREIDSLCFTQTPWGIDVDQTIIDHINENNLEYVYHTTFQKLYHEEIFYKPKFKYFKRWRNTFVRETYSINANIWYKEQTI